MWLFQWNPNSDFYSQYEIGEHIESYDSKSLWTLFKAKRKGTDDPVSIFRFDVREPNSPIIDRAKQSLKRLKTLRHPSILKFIDSNETEKSICIVTEAILPLADYLDSSSDNLSTVQREFSIAYGLLNVAKGIKFMNDDCQLNHNNINIHSIFVNTSGVWKIAGLDYVCPLGENPPHRDNALSEKYTPPERLDPTKTRQPGGKFAVDSWGMGCLVWESFNKPLTPLSSVKTVGKMPKPLSAFYNKLVQTGPRHRVSPMDFVKESKENGVFFNTPSMETIETLDEVQLMKEPHEKVKFFNKLESELECFPKDLCKNKILPDLINAFDYGEAGPSILNPIFKIGRMLSENEFQSKMLPFIIKLFACKDRATRSKLLQQLETYINYLPTSMINDQIFPQVVQGFFDSNFSIREQTVKSMFHLAPKLNATNLNEELLKHLIRLQTRDEEAGIRANATVCMGKIARSFNIHTQQTILIPALVRMLRDPFPPARHASVAGLAANENLFSTKDCATKIMPALCTMSVDPDTNVRRLAFKSLKHLIDRLQAESDKDMNGHKSADAVTDAKHSPTDGETTLDQEKSTKESGLKREIKSLSIRDD